MHKRRFVGLSWNVCFRRIADIAHDAFSPQAVTMRSAVKIAQATLTVLIASVTLGCATVASPSRQASLVEARLTDVQDVTGQPGSPSNCTFNGDVCLDGAYRLKFSVNRLMAGPPVHEDLSVTYTQARPVVGLDYLLVVERTKLGPEIAWAGLARDGLCLEPDDAIRYGLVDELKRLLCRL